MGFITIIIENVKVNFVYYENKLTKESIYFWVMTWYDAADDETIKKLTIHSNLY